MVPWWKRLIYSFISVVVGASVCGACVAAQDFLAHTNGRVTALALSTGILYFDCWVIVLCLPGWVLSTPIVMIVTNIRGWRFWLYWAIGTCFGPLLILAIAFYSALRSPSFAGFPGSSMSLMYLTGAISGLTSLIYLSLLRWGQERSSVSTGAAVV
jgi:hypothetical protein